MGDSAEIFNSSLHNITEGNDRIQFRLSVYDYPWITFCLLGSVAAAPAPEMYLVSGAISNCDPMLLVDCLRSLSIVVPHFGLNSFSQSPANRDRGSSKISS